jgi:hypothetical protein
MGLAEYNPLFADDLNWAESDWAECSSPFFLLDRFIHIDELASRR